jgi:hypothetical protein
VFINFIFIAYTPLHVILGHTARSRQTSRSPDFSQQTPPISSPTHPVRNTPLHCHLNFRPFRAHFLRLRVSYRPTFLHQHMSSSPHPSVSDLTLVPPRSEHAPLRNPYQRRLLRVTTTTRPTTLRITPQKASNKTTLRSPTFLVSNNVTKQTPPSQPPIWRTSTPALL